MSIRLLNVVFAVMVVGVLMSMISIRKMRQEITRSLEPDQRPNMKWWNLARQFQMVRAYRTIVGRGRWAEIYLASTAAILFPVIATFVWAGVEQITRNPR